MKGMHTAQSAIFLHSGSCTECCSLQSWAHNLRCSSVFIAMLHFYRTVCRSCRVKVVLNRWKQVAVLFEVQRGKFHERSIDTFWRHLRKGMRKDASAFHRDSSPCILYQHHHHHLHISFMDLGHLLTRSGLTYPEVPSKVYHDSFCQLGSSVSLPWVIYFEAFYLYVVSSFSRIPVIFLKLLLFLLPL